MKRAEWKAWLAGNEKAGEAARLGFPQADIRDLRRAEEARVRKLYTKEKEA